MPALRSKTDKKPPPTSPLTAIAPPQDPTPTAPRRKPANASGAGVPPAGGRDVRPTAEISSLPSVWAAQQVWLDLAGRTWLRALHLPMEAAQCRSVEDWIALMRRHAQAGLGDCRAGWRDLAALSGRPGLPGL